MIRANSKKSLQASRDVRDREQPENVAALQTTLVRLERRVARLKASEKKLRETREILQKKTHALAERVKELNCLYAVSSLLESHGMSRGATLRRMVDIIAAAWQYPEVTCVRISVNGESFQTRNFQESLWWQSARIRREDKKIGSLDVFYLEEKPPCDEGPFLWEERNLIDVLARRIGEIVEQKEAEAALKESMARNKALLAAIPDMIFRMDGSGRILDLKSGKDFPQIAARRKDLVNRNVMEMWARFRGLPKEVSIQGMKQVQQVLRSGETLIYEEQVPADGKVLSLEVLLTVSGENEVLGIVRDITERRRLERQVLEVSEREQQRIGQDLHDSLSQQLTGLGFLGKVLQQKLEDRSLEEAAEARELVSLIDDAITQTRSLARGLYPVRLEAGGLSSALSELCRTVERRFDIVCSLDCGKPVPVYDTITAIHLYRIAQEAVNNAIRHGKAKEITLRLVMLRDGALLEIVNDGKSFPGVLTSNEGMGLSIMKHRAAMIGASLDIRGKSRGGTVVACTFQNRRRRKERGKP